MWFDEYLKEFKDFKTKLKKFPEYFLNDSSFESVIKKKCFRIVVVGGVGVGKSSVLERLLEIELPNGINSCTRRPLIIKLDSSFNNNVTFNIDSIGIISKEPITINSANSCFDNSVNNPALEFVDLPGLTSMSRPDQPENYPQITRELIEFYTSEADVILLCLAVDADLVNSDALKLVKSLERDDRVVCCLTKFDLLTEELNLESTRTFSGVVSLRNAPLLEMSESIDLTNQREIEFFKGNRQSIKFGIENLKIEILRILKKGFYKMKNEISSLLWREKIKLEGRLETMKDPNFTLKLVTDYIARFEEEDFTNGTRRIGMIFWKSLPEAIDSINILKGIERDNLKILIKNSQGLKTNFHFENSFKFLLKSQLKLSETIIFDCLNLISRELKDFLLLPIDETVEEDEEEFYDVKSVSDTEIEEEPEIEEDFHSYKDYSSYLKSQLKLFPALTKSINRTISKILEESYEKTKEYLKDYCEMQKEMVFCNDSEYIEAFKYYFKTEKDFSKARNKDNDNTSGLVNSVSTSFFSASSIDDLPLKKIQSESQETLMTTTKLSEEETSGFLKEFLALLFPNVQDIKRVEYRPKKRLITREINEKESAINGTESNFINTNTAYTTTITNNNNAYNINNTNPYSTPSSCELRDEEFLLKLLEIYLKSYHVQLKDFLPKCINHHLIQGTLKQLPFKLLNCCKSDSTGKWKEEIKRIERILKLIEETERTEIINF